MKVTFIISQGLPLLLLLPLLPARPVQAEETLPVSALPPAIEDNSFFIEEAYNQEDRVVQHISTFVRLRGAAGASEYSFTQEWPVGSQAHQFSVTVPYAWLPEGGGSSFGNTLLNYRYQLTGHDAWLTLAPRVSLVLPTGPVASRDPGFQVNLPASKRLDARTVIHLNAGATVLRSPDARSWNAGASAIWLATSRLNLMLECVALFVDERDGAGTRARSSETIVSPGLRYAIDVGGLQIVPGLAVPLRHTDGRTRAGLFAYLSLEHPF